MAGRFEILAEAGRGGMGTVFRARDRKERREVALKVLRAAELRDVARFNQEAELLSGLHHPNIVEYVAHGATPDELHYLVMEWVEGDNLAHRLDLTGLDPRETVAMATQITRALAALHARQIVHRDVKPSNLMLVGGGFDRAKLVDFGVARRTSEPGRLTRSGAVVGTAGYMAPEQVRGGNTALDGRADLFALGCVMFECLTGEQAFVGETTLAAHAKVLVHDPPPLRVLDPTLPVALEALVSSLLSRHPDLRPAGAVEVERALGAIDELPRGRATRRTDERTSATKTSATLAGDEVCALLVSWRTDADADAATCDRLRSRLADASVDAIEGGLVVRLTCALHGAARIALGLADQFPRATIALASGASIALALDDGARLIEEIEIDSVDETIAGVWSDREIGLRLGAAFRAEPRGRRVRIHERSPARGGSDE